MPDKIVNHFVLADGSVARYDASELANIEQSPIGKINDVVGETVAEGWQSVVLPATGSPSTGIHPYASTTRVSYNNRVPIEKGSKLFVTCPDGYKYRVLFFTQVGTLDAEHTYGQAPSDTLDWRYWYTINRVIDVPQEAKSFAVTLAKVNDVDFGVSDVPADFIVEIQSIFETAEKIVSDIGTQNGSYFKPINTNWLQGNVPISTNMGDTLVTSTTRCASGTSFPVKGGQRICVSVTKNNKYRVTFYNQSGVYIATDSDTTWQTATETVRAPSDACYFRVSVAYLNDANITPSDCENVDIFVVDGIFANALQFKNKKLSILGDSISTYAGENAESASDGHTIADGLYTYAGNHCRYPNSYLSNVNDTYWKQLIDALDMVLGINDSWAGSTVTYNSDGSDSSADICISSQTRIGHLDDNGVPDYILVNAGTNDIGLSKPIGTFNTESPKDYSAEQIANLSVDTFADAYRAMLIRLQKTYPLSKVVVMLPNYTTSYYNPTKADQYLEVIKEACDYFGVPWVDMRATGFNMYNTSTYTGDGIHPNVAGMELMATKMIKFFKYSL